MAQLYVPQSAQSIQDERILVVKRQWLFPDGVFNGLKQVDFDQYAALITQHQEFLPRSAMEIDVTYKQIIPYLVFTHKGRYFLMQRDASGSEASLRNKMTLGIGGHIVKEDMEHNDICAWARREFHEEVNYAGSLRIEPIGMLNDDSTDVGKVHVGFVFLLHGDSADISIKSEMASGNMVSLAECVAYSANMESWSHLVLNYLSINRFNDTLVETV